jgi:hypothetical protein
MQQLQVEGDQARLLPHEAGDVYSTQGRRRANAGLSLPQGLDMNFNSMVPLQFYEPL